MEKRLEKLKEILKKSKLEREKERKMEEDMRASVHSKLDKEKEEKRRRLEMKRRQEEKWGMIRWLTDFMDLETNSVDQSHQITTTGNSPTNPGSENDKTVNMGDKAEQNDIEMVISGDGDETGRKLTVVTTNEEVGVENTTFIENTVLMLDERNEEVLLNRLEEKYCMEVGDGDLMLGQ